MNFKSKIVELDALIEMRETFRKQGKTVVQCHGCFDIVHPGHIRYLQFAKQQGDILIVSVSGDEVVGKGVDRPYINEDLRAENLAVFEFVDYVCLDYHTWAGPVLESLQPDIYVKGKEYETNLDPRFVKEKKLIEESGGNVIFCSGDVVFSSTLIIDKFHEKFSLEQEKINFFCKRHSIDSSSITNTFTQFIGKKILVIGDPILDYYVHCESIGVAAESPVLTVSPAAEEYYVGGAGFIAKQLSILGADVSLLVPTAEGEHFERFREGLEQTDVTVLALDVPQRPIYIKKRYLVDNKKLLKVDSGHYAPLSTVDSNRFLEELTDSMVSFDAVVATDFGYGLFGAELIKTLSEMAHEKNIPQFADVSQSGHANILKFKHAHTALPTEQELRFAFGDNESGLSNLAALYFKETQGENLVITMGSKGALLFLNQKEEGSTRYPTEYLPSFTKNHVDTIGAGDVFLSGMVVSALAGQSTAHALYLGSCLAAVHINCMGNEPVSLMNLQNYISQRPEISED